MDDPTFDLDHEEDVVALEEDGVDAEEVGREHSLGLGAQELGPTRTRSPRCRRKAVPAQDVGDAAFRHRDAELSQLTHDAEVAPARVLPRQAHDERDRLLGKRWPSGTAVRVGPPPSDKGSVPAQDRLGRDEERRPALSVDEACQRGDECPVRPGEAGSGDLAADRQLVPQHQDLGVLGYGVHAVDRQGFYDATKETVEEAERHASHDR